MTVATESATPENSCDAIAGGSFPNRYNGSVNTSPNFSASRDEEPNCAGIAFLTSILFSFVH